MSVPRRPLAGCRVGLSISESDDSARRGFPGWQVNRTTLQVVDALFGQGAGVVFGHDWRDDGVMTAIHGFASNVQLLGEGVGEAGGRGEPLLVNLVPWPEKPHLPEGERERLAATLRVEEAGLPDALREFRTKTRADLPPDVYAYLRARALTHLRHRLDERSTARLCIGGRTRGYQGRYAGIAEEALVALQRGTPLYLSGVLGGASRQIIAAVNGGGMPADFTPPAEIARLYAQPPAGIREEALATHPDCEVDPEAVWSAFRDAGIATLSRSNGLSEDENVELFRTPVLDRVVKFVLKGLSNLQARPDA